MAQLFKHRMFGKAIRPNIGSHGGVKHHKMGNLRSIEIGNLRDRFVWQRDEVRLSKSQYPATADELARARKRLRKIVEDF